MQYGEPGGVTAMALTVSMRRTDHIHSDSLLFCDAVRQVGAPTGIAASLVASGEIREPGVLRPLTPSIYEPILTALEGEGIAMVES